MNKKIGQQDEKLIELVGKEKPKDIRKKRLAREEKGDRNISTKPLGSDRDNKEKEKIEEIHCSNLLIEQNNLEVSKTDSDEAKKKKRKQNKFDDLFCESCSLSDKNKLIDCYLCKKIKCKSCADKESQYSSKKRDQSSYICESCFNKDSNKIRKKQTRFDFQEALINESDQYAYDPNNSYKNDLLKNFGGKLLMMKDEEINKKLEEFQENEKDEMLNLDILYDCISPPSELKGDNGFKGKTNISNKMTQKKRKRTKNYLDPNFSLICHQCVKCNPKVEYYRCAKADCGKYYCNKCIRKYSSVGNIKHTNRINKTLNFCYSCRKICKCLPCQKEYCTKISNNFVQIDLENLDANKNLIKIDDYVILENADEEEDLSEEKEEEESEKESESSHEESHLDNNDIISKEVKETNAVTNNENLNANEDEKIKNCVDAVENSRNAIKSNKLHRCIMCSNESNDSNYRNSLKFKSLEEFIIYLKFFFSQITVRDHPDYSESQREYNDYLSNYFKKYYSNSDYVFKSIKIICRDCFTSSLKVKNGFYNLFSSLHIGHNLSNTAVKMTESKLRNNPATSLSVITNSLEGNNEMNPFKTDDHPISPDEHNNFIDSEEKLPDKAANYSQINSNSISQSNYQISHENISSKAIVPTCNIKNDINYNNLMQPNNRLINSMIQANDSNSMNQKGFPINSSLLNHNERANNLTNNYYGPTNLINSTQNISNNSNINKLYEIFNNMRQSQNTSSNMYANSMIRNLINQSLNNSTNGSLNLNNLSNLSDLIDNNDFNQFSQNKNRSNLEIPNTYRPNIIENKTTFQKNIRDNQNCTGFNNNQNCENNVSSNQQESNTEKDNLFNLLNNLNSEALNVTNIIMNIDNNNKNLGGCSGNVLDDLKRQFFCIQYYSLLQKLFISYIFKNLELFIEQISKNQSLGEYVVNNLANSIPKSSNINTDNNSTEIQQLVQNINDQMALLKNINHYGVNLTNALSSNFEDLKSNGIKIFKAMDPSIQQSVVSNLNYLVNTLSDNNQGNLSCSSNSFLNNPDIHDKSNNTNNNNTGGITNNNTVNATNNIFNPISSNNATYDSLLQNFNAIVNNLSNNSNLQNQTNSLFGGINPFAQTKFSKNIANSSNVNHLNNINNLGNLSGMGSLNPLSMLSSLSQLNQINQLGNTFNSINNSSNKSMNLFGNLTQGMNLNSSMHLNPQVISEMLTQNNSSSSGNNQINLMNLLSIVNKNLMSGTNSAGITGSNNLIHPTIGTNPNANNLSSSQVPQLNSNLFINMMGMNQTHFPLMNQHMNNLSQMGKKMTNLVPIINENESVAHNENQLNTPVNHLHGFYENNLQQTHEQAKSTDDKNQNNNHIEINDKNNSEDIEIEKIEMNLGLNNKNIDDNNLN